MEVAPSHVVVTDMTDGGARRGIDIEAGLLAEFAAAGFAHIVGGCCGTPPEHIRAIARAVAGVPRRRLPQPAARLPA